MHNGKTRLKKEWSPLNAPALIRDHVEHVASERSRNIYMNWAHCCGSGWCWAVPSAQVFLQHLSPLLSLPTFAALWLTILDFMDRYMHAGSSDLLVSTVFILTFEMILSPVLNELLWACWCTLRLHMQLEAIPESLKNMLLVMDTAGIFHSADSRTGYSDLWEITWERIICFLPNLREELFKQTVKPGMQLTHEHVWIRLVYLLHTRDMFVLVCWNN